MIDEKLRKEIIDEEHLRLLGLFHYIFGGIVLAYSALVLLYFVFFLFVFETIWHDYPMNTFSYQEELNPGFFKLLMIIGIFIFVIMLVVGILELLSGKFIKAKKHRNFSYVIAIINLLSIPYGTILGIMTLTVLGKNSVKELYFRNTFEEKPLQSF
jgi:hypothetical protein